MLFAYCLLLTLLHSLWQAGVQVLLYATAEKTVLQKARAVAKRNLLLLQVMVQIVLSAITFFIYYTQPTGEIIILLQSYADIGIALKPYLYAVAPWLITVYFVWLAAKIINLFIAWRQFASLYKTGLQKPDIDLKLFTKVTASHMGIKKNVQLWFSNNIHTPITFGHFKPIILLPVALVNQVSMQQAEALIVHELTHIKVNDYLLNWLLAAAETLFFFNPFVKYLSNQAKLEREKYCDTTVLHFGKHPVVYAETLLMAAKLQQENVRWQMAAVSNKKQLLRRIIFFTSGTPLHHKRSRTSMALAPLLLVASIFMAALVIAVLPSNPLKKQSVAVARMTPPQALLLPNRNNVQAFDKVAEEETVRTMNASSLSLRADKPITQRLPSATTITDDYIGLETSSSTDGLIPNPNGSIINVSMTNEPITREMVVEEETPGTGVKTLQVYVLTLKNGTWEMTPKFMATSRILSVDTALLKFDTLQIRLTKSQ